MKELPSIVQLIEAFTFFPSVGEKSAERMAYSLIDMKEEKVLFLIKAIEDAKKRIHQCPNCGILIDSDTCPICSSTERDKSTCIVVSFPKDVFPFERTNEYRGTYHVLNGEISSSKGTTIDDLNIDSLFERIQKEGIKEIIIATNPTIEGETTALYISKMLEGKNIKITKLARGIPMGSTLEYSDNLTIIKALEGRRDI